MVAVQQPMIIRGYYSSTCPEQRYNGLKLNYKGKDTASVLLYLVCKQAPAEANLKTRWSPIKTYYEVHTVVKTGRY